MDSDKNYLFELPHLGMISVNGPRAAELLQGQLSCDVNHVNSTTMRKGALCNLKGRVQALVDVINWQGLKLVLPCDLINQTMDSLAKAAMLSRVVLSPDSDYKLFGFYLNNPEDLLPSPLTAELNAFSAVSTDDSYCYAIGDNFYLIINIAKTAFTLTDPFISQQQMRGSLAWHRLQLDRPRVEIYPESRGAFLPHRLNLHKTDYISFDKGCYKGQEIVARTHYRAKLKHGLKNFFVSSKLPLHSGQKLLNLSDNAEIGELVDFCPLSADNYLIVASILNEHPEVARLEGQDVAITLNTTLSS